MTDRTDPTALPVDQLAAAWRQYAEVIDRDLDGDDDLCVQSSDEVAGDASDESARDTFRLCADELEASLAHGARDLLASIDRLPAADQPDSDEVARYVKRTPERFSAARHDGTKESADHLRSRFSHLMVWSTGAGYHLADDRDGDNPPLLGPGDWIVALGREYLFVTDDDFRAEFVRVR